MHHSYKYNFIIGLLQVILTENQITMNKVVLILIISAIITSTTKAQECNVRRVDDEVTGRSYGSIDKISIGEPKGGENIEIWALSNYYTNSIYFDLNSGKTCVRSDDSAYILWTDGTRVRLKNYGEFNCEGRFTFRFIDKRDFFKEITSKLIKTIRVYTDDTIVERSPSLAIATKIRNEMTCLLKAEFKKY